MQKLWMEIHALSYNARIAADEGDDEAATAMLEKRNEKEQEYLELEQNQTLDSSSNSGDQ